MAKTMKLFGVFFSGIFRKKTLMSMRFKILFL